MEPYRGMQDILFGYDTDIHFENGDLMLTTGIDYIERELYKLLITSPGDWQADRLAGCSPNDFVGDQNTREVAQSIESYIQKGLQFTVSPGILDVRVVPTSETTLMIAITIKIDGDEIFKAPFEFDFVTGFKKLTRLDPRIEIKKTSQNYKLNSIEHLKRPNKYVERMRDQSLRG